MFLFRWLWNLLLLVVSVSLTVAWIGFVFGSVVGVVLLVIFAGVEGFLLPMGLLALWWKAPERSERRDA